MNERNYFVGIGAQKSGTTWLAKYFADHPQVFMSSPKELHCFDTIYLPIDCFDDIKYGLDDLKDRLLHAVKPLQNSLRSNYINNKKDLNIETFNFIYRKYFESLVGQESVFGEITPAYSMLNNEGYQHILNVYPHAKFIFLLRNPADRCWSHAKHRKKRKFVKEDLPIKSIFQQELNTRKYVLRTDYTRTIAELKKVVPSSQILTIFYENLFSRNGYKEVKKITDFLGIQYIEPDLNTYVYKGLDAELDSHLRMEAINRFKHVYFGVYSEFKYNLPNSWWNDILLLYQQNLAKHRSRLLDIQKKL